MVIDSIEPPGDLDLGNALREERHLLETVDVPIVTVSATYRKELAKQYLVMLHPGADVVYSRAHYSMAEAVRQQAIHMGKTAHLSDPTNFVSQKDWKKIEFTQTVGLMVARHRFLRSLKGRVDKVLRGKLPIKDAITPPLLYLTGSTSNPIISMHYETGNILARGGKVIIQAVTDPHVHFQYLFVLPQKDKQKPGMISDITFAVFDEETRLEFFKVAKLLNKEVRPDQVVVTGPFVDPRVTKIGMKEKKIKNGDVINIAITTGGLGTNLNEVKKILEEFRPLLVPPEKIRLFLYAGTHRDFRNYYEEYAAANSIRIGNLDDEKARIRILYDDSIIDANENMIKYMFPWAHGVVTKPSGDMAYDAAAAGCFLLFLEPWGVWEENVQKIFVGNGVGYDLEVSSAYKYFSHLLENGQLENALKAAHKLPDLYREGCKNLIKLHQGKQ